MRAVSHFIIGLLFTGSLHLSAQILYTVTDLGIFGQPVPYPVLYGLNNVGQVVGEANICCGGRVTRPVLWQSGADPQDLGTLGGYSINSPRDINDAGQVVGYSYTYGVSNEVRAFVWQSGTGMQDLGTLGGTSSAAGGINNGGQVVGSSSTASNESHAFLWQGGSGMQDLGTLGGTSSAAFGINSRGQVVGYSETVSGSPQTHAFLWQSGTGMQDLGTLGGGTSSGAWAINKRGQVVGYSSTTSDRALHAFIYSNGQMTDLNDLIDPALGVLLYWATDINDSGQIVAYGQGHPYLLTPISAGCAGPVISDVSATPNVLWPPNHKFVPVSIGYTVDDRCPSKCGLSVSSNEPLNGKGDGNTSADWKVIDGHQVQLRAERAGNGSGRVYTVSVTCTNDTTEQPSTKAIQVLVPHDPGH